MCHAQCTHLVPDLCGMSLQMANEILATIKSTKVSPKTKANSGKVVVLEMKQEPNYQNQEYRLPLQQEKQLHGQQQHKKPLPPKPSILGKSSGESVETLRNSSEEEPDDNDFNAKLPTTTQNRIKRQWIILRIHVPVDVVHLLMRS